jgi:hypothetical protein
VLGVTRFEGGIVGSKAHGIQDMVNVNVISILVGWFLRWEKLC